MGFFVACLVRREPVALALAGAGALPAMYAPAQRRAAHHASLQEVEQEEEEKDEGEEEEKEAVKKNAVGGARRGGRGSPSRIGSSKEALVGRTRLGSTLRTGLMVQRLLSGRFGRACFY